jgi:hypothetical protein
MTPADLRAFRPSPPITAEAWLSWEQEDPPSGSTTWCLGPNGSLRGSR